jgi:uncharacterized protein involved in exopolysaccharide biosynthesis
MLNLDQKFAEWRQSMIAGGVTDPAVLDELEGHLRDHVEEQVRSGCDAGQAFQAGVLRIGQPGVLKREFLRADGILSGSRMAAFLDDRRKCFWLAFGLAALVAVGFYALKTRVTPVYTSTATAQLMKPSWLRSAVSPRESADRNDVHTADPINTAIQLLNSQRMRAKVAGSLIPIEQDLVVRAAARRRALGQPAPSAYDWLGALTIRPLRLTFIVAISVTHHDADAAALIANRYVQQWQAELASSTGLEGLTARQLDLAQPARSPSSPNLGHILQASAALALTTFVALIAAAALLRRLLRMRPPSGPELKIE